MGSDWLNKIAHRLAGTDAPTTEAEVAALMERNRNLARNSVEDADRHHEEWVHWFDAIRAKDAEIARLRAALEFYADPHRYGARREDGTWSCESDIDAGARARRALEGEAPNAD